MAQPETTPPHERRSWASWRTFRLLLLYSFTWFVLTGGDSASWVLGVPAVLLAFAVSVILAPTAFFSLNPVGLLTFIPYFIMLSAMSGIDVLRRTFSRVPRIDPAVFSFKTRLEGTPRILLANIISLLPGTLSADLQGDEIRVHVLDRKIPAEKSIRSLEDRIDRIFHRQVMTEDSL